MQFLSTPSARRATRQRGPCRHHRSISIHALREEGDPPRCCLLLLFFYFYPRPPRGGRPTINQLRQAFQVQFLSTPSARRATESGHPDQRDNGNFYPRPPRGGRQNHLLSVLIVPRISIHALREEGDAFSARAPRTLCYFYPRPPRGGRRGCLASLCSSQQFLSTPSARRATVYFPDTCRQCEEFLSTPSARRATAKTETKSLFSNKLYNILHEFRRALIYNGSKNYPNHAKRLKNPVRRCRKDAEDSPFAPGRKTQNNSRPSCSKGG